MQNYTPEQIAHIEENCTPIDREEAFREMLNDCYGQIDVCGYKYDAADLLESVDPTAFRCGVADYFANSDYIEIGGETYHAQDAEDALQDLADSKE